MFFKLKFTEKIKIIKNIFRTKQRKTFLLHLVYSIIEGIILGFLALNEFVLIKGLDGSNNQIGILFQFAVIVLLFSVIFNEFFKRSRNKKRLLRFAAIITRLPLILFLFFPKTPNAADLFSYQLIFLVIFFIFYLANPIIMPAINIFLKKNYTHENFSKLYSYATTVNKIVMLFATFAFGIILDINPNSYIYFYPSIAFLGILSVFILTKIDFEQSNEIIPKNGFFNSIKDSFKNMNSIIKKNKPFRDFETGFMFYGFAWMLAVAVIAIFMSKKLDLNYTSLAFYKNSYNIVSILITPFFGKLMGKIDPRKFSVYTYAAMLIYILFMGLTEYFPAKFEFMGLTIYYSLIISFFSYGIFGAMMSLLWYIGTAYFCDDNQSADYQAIHLNLTGLRGAFIPLTGVLLYSKIGYSGIFGLGVFFLFIAIIVNILSIKKENKIIR
jgi:Na+/melibiose symporter-like transporter